MIVTSVASCQISEIMGKHCEPFFFFFLELTRSTFKGKKETIDPDSLSFSYPEIGARDTGLSLKVAGRNTALESRVSGGQSSQAGLLNCQLIQLLYSAWGPEAVYGVSAQKTKTQA